MVCRGMPPLDLIAPMGVLLTVTTFLVGFAELRTRTFFDELPRLVAAVISGSGEERDEGVRRYEEVSGESDRRQRFIWLVYGLLFLANVGLFVLAWRGSQASFNLDGGIPTEVWVVAAILGCHLVVLTLGVLDQRWAARRRQRVLEASPVRPFLAGLAINLSVEDDPATQRRVASDRLHKLEVALDRMPAGVSTLALRRELNMARLGLAQVLVDQRNPGMALKLLDQIDAAGVAEVEFLLRHEAGRDLANLVERLGPLGVEAARARSYELLGDPSRALDVWLEALRVAPEHFHDFGPLITNAQASGRMADVVTAVDALITGSAPPPWVDDVLRGLAAHLHMAKSEPRLHQATLHELRLLALSERSKHPADSPWVLELAERLLEEMPSLEVLAWRPTADQRLAEADALLGQDRPEGKKRSPLEWYRLRGRLLRARGRAAEAYATLLEALPASDLTSRFYREELLESAREAGMVNDLRENVTKLPADHGGRRSLLRSLTDKSGPAGS
jgi:hypothetical protein